MPEDKIAQYAKSIIAVANGRPSTFFQEDITYSQEIVKFLQIGNLSRASQKITSIFQKAKIPCEQEVPSQIADKIIELLGL